MSQTETITWISVQEGLPAKDIFVLVTADRPGFVYKAYLSVEGWYWESGHIASCEICAWAELPKGYQAEEGGEK